MERDLEHVAAAAHDELCAWLEARNASARNRVTFAAAKHIAAVALCLEAAEGLAREVALDVATALAERRLRFSRGSLKKNRSEALAILQFGPAPQAAADTPRRVFFEAVLQANISEVRRARADTLRGARGGRPAIGRPHVLAMVRELIRKATRDPHAANELQLIRSELSS